MDYLITRLLCAFLSGALLSQGGSFIQIATRNVLASPSTLGFDGLAVLWVLLIHSFSVFIGIPSYLTLITGIPVFIFIGFIFRHVLHENQSYERIVLLGITFNLLVGAIFSLWQFLFLAYNLPFPIELWFGHFRFADTHSLIKLACVEAGLFIGMKYFWNELQMHTLGREIFKNFPVPEKALFGFVFGFISISTFVVVSTFGAFSFLGLVFPLVARKLWFKKFDLKGEFVYGSLFNGLAFMMIDWLCYEFPFYGAEIPVGLIVTGVGAVSLILILWNSSPRELLANPKK